MAAASAWSIVAVACGGAQEEAPQAKRREKVTLQHTPWPGGPARPSQTAIVEAFNASHPDIQIVEQILPGSGNLYEKLLVQAAANTLPDSTYMNETNVPLFATKGILAPIDQVIKKDRQFNEKERLTPVSKQAITLLNKIWALPVQSGTYITFFNKNMLAEAGVAAPKSGWTWQDLLDRGRRLTRDVRDTRVLGYGQRFGFEHVEPWMAGITPFNFPAMIPMWKFAPAIACGNAFILKPSERDPGVPMMLAELMMEAGLPAGILNVVNGDKEAVDAILDHRDIQAIGFVGSTPIAEYIYARGCAAGKRVQCFGGAKNHMIIMPDADMDQTVDALVGAGYGSAGERCMAVSVAVPVGAKTADLLMEKLMPRVEALKIGPSTSTDADFGPVVTAAHLKKVKDYVEIGIKEGAKLRVDGRDFKMQGYEKGFYMGGCLFDEVTADMRIYKEEIFGPVLSVVRAKTYDEGLKLANDHEYGNGVAIFTRDGDAARDFAAKVNVGMVGINVPIPVPLAYYTFGGWKRSGFGDLNQHGPDSVRFYTKTKTVTSRWPSGVKEGAEFVIPTMK